MDSSITSVVYLVLISILIVGLVVVIGYVLLSRSEMKVDDKIETTYERASKEFTKGDQNVLNNNNTKIGNINNSISNLSKSVQNIRSNGNDTVVTGDLCINNLCVGSSNNKIARVNLDDLAGFNSAQFPQNYQADLQGIKNDMTSIQHDLESKINDLGQAISFGIGMLGLNMVKQE